MRTKVLLLSSVALAAGLVASQAQSNVYSANVVGYYNFALTNNSDFTAFANQLDFDGTGTNNTVNSVIGTNLPLSSKILAWNTNLQSFQTITPRHWLDFRRSRPNGESGSSTRLRRIYTGSWSDSN